MLIRLDIEKYVALNQSGRIRCYYIYYKVSKIDCTSKTCQRICFRIDLAQNLRTKLMRQAIT